MNTTAGLSNQAAAGDEEVFSIQLSVFRSLSGQARALWKAESRKWEMGSRLKTTMEIDGHRISFAPP
jgi:hypothetical protein